MIHDLGGWFASFFAWPDGGVWSNLLASVIWTLPALRWHHKRIKEHVDRALQTSPTPPDIKITLGGPPTGRESEPR